MVRTTKPVIIDPRINQTAHVRFNVEQWAWNHSDNPRIEIHIGIYIEDETGDLITQRPAIIVNDSYVQETFLQMMDGILVTQVPAVKDQILAAQIAAYPEKYWGLTSNDLEIVA